ncbi:TetR/AcrR family transcriptional regulator [Pseudolysinimonas yzui]|uniref:TetR family transcriptional regulator n=1 Tax=Pseudolysinimonas yzui TaxID=2708254 RepID=A0A8J3LY77_9MICO|nr:TetR/AcrR family transcriptional regulator [Pseudolysinimonas yzui]GHF05735.1 TetR family transcriptional regulator [Pseudolysinimonas yzui]
MVTEPSRRGRKRDPERDAVILDAALAELAESGYAGMTTDAVAARAGVGKAAMYRRWPSKAELALDAVARLDGATIDPDALPDTGSLRGDLRAILALQDDVDDERRLRVMVGLASMLADDERLAAAITAPWIDANRTILRRAVARGEIAPTTDVETMAGIIPTLVTYRVCFQRLPIPPSYVGMLVETVLLPALGVDGRQQH